MVVYLARRAHSTSEKEIGETHLFVDGPALGLPKGLALLPVVDDLGVLGPRLADGLPGLEALPLLDHGELLGHVERLVGVSAAIVGPPLDLGVDLVERG